MRRSILVVEDDADVCELLVGALAVEGNFAVQATGHISGARALMAKCSEPFSLVVLDVGLPDGDGRDFCAGLRRQGFHAPVILLTGLSGEDDIVQGLDAGADDYLVKPFHTDELLARIGAQLRHTPQKHGIPDHRTYRTL